MNDLQNWTYVSACAKGLPSFGRIRKLLSMLTALKYAIIIVTFTLSTASFIAPGRNRRSRNFFHVLLVFYSDIKKVRISIL